jgi:GNAT superfamily N-acetyltransferase
MTDAMLFSGAEAERLADEIEARASRDLYAAAPPGMRTRSVAIGGATALIAPTLPVSYFNRVIGLGNESPATADAIDRIITAYSEVDVKAYWIHLVPSARPSSLPALLSQRGFVQPPRRSWAKFLRGAEAPPLPRTDLRLREARPVDADAVAAVLCAAFGMPPVVGPWFGGLIGRPGWRVWVAEQGGRVVATGSLYVYRETGWLGAGATLADHRGHGAQTALLATRMAAAAEAGCRILATETGEPVKAEPNPSLSNIRRAGFVQICSRLNYASP